ncbi:translesion error-prone DNA polymerase V autoproteolytic subunit [Nitratidesulfovibrio liaohensis]|uniref:Translesion error-prone DNA polymerase V autoproteolytic subunit n=1 Tax=Nitratidesulfovibrio liaohensis TaxID=2604158 RepID=A0ABY9R7Q0_9BACT|nr:translesion error-prone DNA polymerase V autoproteolytic subunit [Nitratidesulfovibrio liaohensis]WMW67068.1 translesion error-prone DNA polymerase V autoproteolytic subunit [Nitratidesulfovibrio liaohensis]
MPAGFPVSPARSVSPASAAPRAPSASGVRVACPLLLARVAAGFPSPADDYLDRPLDIAEHLIRHPEATFFLRAQGQSMIGAGIHDGDLLVVDRAVEPVHNKVAIVAVDGELTVKRLHLRAGRVVLLPENPDYEPLDVTGRDDVHVWGVVTYVVHAL